MTIDELKVLLMQKHLEISNSKDNDVWEMEQKVAKLEFIKELLQDIESAS